MVVFHTAYRPPLPPFSRLLQLQRCGRDVGLRSALCFELGPRENLEKADWTNQKQENVSGRHSAASGMVPVLITAMLRGRNRRLAAKLSLLESVFFLKFTR